MQKSKNKPFERILIIMFENQYRSYVMQNDYFRSLASQGIDMANYFGVMHPSQTNYIASITGELCNITDDDAPQTLLQQQTIVDLLEAADVSWKAYMDSYIPQATPWKQWMVPQNQYPYVIKHNPFSSFKNIVQNKNRWEKIVNESQFWQDVLADNLPQYAWFTPNMWNDGHYLVGTQLEPHKRAPVLIDQAANWLKSFFTTLRFPGTDSRLPTGMLVVITFDEADFMDDFDDQSKSTYDGPNQIYTVLLGDMIRPGVEVEGYNHYSLLKTIQKNYRLASLHKNDEGANWFQFLWGKQFAWGSPLEIPIQSSGDVAAAAYKGLLFVVYPHETGVLVYQIFDGEGWTDSESIGQKCRGGVALAAYNDELILVYETLERTLASLHYHFEKGWSQSPKPIVDSRIGAFALTAVAYNKTLMLAWSDAQGTLYSRCYAKYKWDDKPTPVGQQTDGYVALTTLGASIFLICKAPGNYQINVTTYNTATFNVTTIKDGKWSGPYDDSVKDKWSPSTFPVAHFAYGPNPRTPRENEPHLQPYLAQDRVAVAEYEGVIHLVHPVPHESLVSTETFSISGVLTPKLPILYQKSDTQTTSNGFGTLAQAGWSAQSLLKGVYHRGGQPMVMCRYEGGIVLIYRESANANFQMCRGGYNI